MNQNILIQTQEEELLSIMALFGEATPAQWTGLIWVQSITHPHVSSSIYLYIIAIIARGCNRFGPGTQDSVPGHPVLSTRVPSTRTLVTMPNLIQWAFCCNSKLASIGNTELSRQITKTTKKSSPPLLPSPALFWLLTFSTGFWLIFSRRCSPALTRHWPGFAVVGDWKHYSRKTLHNYTMPSRLFCIPLYVAIN